MNKEDQMSNLQDKIEKNNHLVNNNDKKKTKKEWGSFKGLCDNMKHNNICFIEILEEEESEQWIGNLFEEIMTENFPNPVKEKVTQVQEA